MRYTQLAEALGEGQWRCNVCQWHCHLANDEVGRCLVRVARPDGIEVINDGMISAAVVSPIEDYRLWHLLPGAKVLGIGSWGYAFPADQQRGQYARLPDDPSKQRRLAPDRAATFALERLCRGVVWNFGDPSVSQEYVLELMQLSRASSRFTAMVTTSYSTLEAIDQLGHYLDAISLDLRGFDDSAYGRLSGVEQWRGILETAAHAKQRWGCHIEVTTRVHPGVNDSSEQLQGMASWIRDTLGPHTPWHVLPGDAGASAATSVARARRIGHESGLSFIYGADPSQNTLCPKCGRVIIERGQDSVRVVSLSDGGCGNCGADLQIRTSIFKR